MSNYNGQVLVFSINVQRIPVIFNMSHATAKQSPLCAGKLLRTDTTQVEN
jgi:hypothetical protein